MTRDATNPRDPRATPQLLATLGPASLKPGVIARLDEAGVTLFRINLSHTEPEELEGIVASVRRVSDVPICFDSEGAQIRTGVLPGGACELEVGHCVDLVDPGVGAGAEKDGGFSLPLLPAGTTRRLEAGDLVSVDFNGSLLQVVEATAAGTRTRVLRGGKVGSNKAVSLQRPIALPALSDKDRRAIEMGRALGIRHYALSFAGCGEDVEQMRALLPDEAQLISKIETRRALRNFDGIAGRSDAVLIDRGDLSREVEVAQIPRIQRALITRGRELATPVYVATNLLESMLEAPTPTRAEVNDIYTTLRDGADGLVLAAETAIGRHPVQCAQMVMKVAAGDPRGIPHLEPLPLERTSRLVPPRGGAPIEPTQRVPEARATRSIEVPGAVFDLAQQIASRALWPLRGFAEPAVAASAPQEGADEADVPQVLALPQTRATARMADDRPGDVIALTARDRVGRLGLQIDATGCGVDSTSTLSGEIVLLGHDTPRGHPLELTPETARTTLEARGWTRVAGAVISNFDPAALRDWVRERFETDSVDGVVLGWASPEDLAGALSRQAEVLQALEPWAGQIITTGWPPLGAPTRAARRALDAIRYRNFGCSQIGFELDSATADPRMATTGPIGSPLSRPPAPPMSSGTG